MPYRALSFFLQHGRIAVQFVDVYPALLHIMGSIIIGFVIIIKFIGIVLVINIV